MKGTSDVFTRRMALGTIGSALSIGLLSRPAQSTPVPKSLSGFEHISPPILLPRIKMQTADEAELESSDLLGRPFVLNLWASWCLPCVKELPSLQAMNQHKAARFKVILINQDKAGTDVALRFLTKLGITELKSYFDTQGRLYRALSGRGLPSTFFGDPQGNLVGRYEGAADWENMDVIHFTNALIAAEK